MNNCLVKASQSCNQSYTFSLRSFVNFHPADHQTIALKVADGNVAIVRNADNLTLWSTQLYLSKGGKLDMQTGLYGNQHLLPCDSRIQINGAQ